MIKHLLFFWEYLTSSLAGPWEKVSESKFSTDNLINFFDQIQKSKTRGKFKLTTYSNTERSVHSLLERLLREINVQPTATFQIQIMKILY